MRIEEAKLNLSSWVRMMQRFDCDNLMKQVWESVEVVMRRLDELELKLSSKESKRILETIKNTTGGSK